MKEEGRRREDTRRKVFALMSGGRVSCGVTAERDHNLNLDIRDSRIRDIVGTESSYAVANVRRIAVQL